MEVEPGYLSDESNFYGDEDTKQELEARVLSLDVGEWWKHRIPTLMELAEDNVKTQKLKKTVKLYNPYEGRVDSRQLTETIDEFVKRLPPATTFVTLDVQWIWIANPYRKVMKEANQDAGSHMKEAPPDEKADKVSFEIIARSLLEELTNKRLELEKKNPGKAKSTITKLLKADQDRIVKEILGTAKTLHVTCGKWMLFRDSEHVNDTWAVVARATANNELGIAAKVAPDDGQNKMRLICVYTKDFTDMADVSRVVHRMRELGLVENQIWYKCGELPRGPQQPALN
ncbi:DUF1917-domain-containing protein [Acephala macrosclerotiorum]|nr:DUF1917-domain-containing protein [Acephala macrosclerotiorum]